MNIKEILNENLIDLDLKATTKREVFYELSKLLKNSNYIEDVDTFIEDIFKREEEGITGIGNNIAIPHGKSSQAKKVGLAIGRTNNLIEWESIDEEPVNLIFLFCVSDDVNYAKNHLMILSSIAGKLGNNKTVESLKKATDKLEIIKILSE